MFMLLYNNDKSRESGINIPKVIFRDGEALPPNLSEDANNPQNIWLWLMHAQQWANTEILGIGTNYQYTEATYTTDNEVILADKLRESGETIQIKEV
jgi:hypothetical protein